MPSLAVQTGLFPWAVTGPARGYNRIESIVPMTNCPPNLDLQSLTTALAERLASQLLGTARSLGLRMTPARIAEASWRLLGGSGGISSASAAASDDVAAPLSEESFEAHDYLHLVPEEMRRALGQVMTPQPIVRYILRAAGYRADAEILDRTLCDPACGSGVFLVEAVRIYLSALRVNGIPETEWYPRVVSHFTGLDVDPLACLYARFNLSLLLAGALLAWMQAHPRRLPEPLPVSLCDTLETLAAEIGGRHGSAPGPGALSWMGAFDFIVGNPPYRKVSPLSPVLRETFQESLYGHPNAYGMFLHAGLEMLRPGGRLGFIIPRSMLSGLYFQNLRRMLEEQTCIEELSLLAERKNVFPQVLQGTMIIVFRKPMPGEVPAAEDLVRTSVVRSAAELGNGGPSSVSARAAQVARRLNGTTVWFVSDQERTYSLLDKIIGRHPLLGGPVVACPARTGPIVWNRVKPLLRPRAAAGRFPLVWATDVGRFRFEFATAGHTRPAYLEASEKLRDLATSGPSLLVQRITADEQARRLVVSRSGFPFHQRYFVENHLNVLQPAPAAGIDLHFLLGVLSSDVVEFFFRSMNGNTQVSATELNLLPIPRGSFEAEIAALIGAIEEAGSGSQRADLEVELHARIARAYGLTSRDLGFLQRILRERLCRSADDTLAETDVWISDVQHAIDTQLARAYVGRADRLLEEIEDLISNQSWPNEGSAERARLTC
jgi:adenine-specific DNA-methyltransferase